MSSQRKNKCTSPCFGCHLPKAEHGFGAMHNNCNGPDVSDSENSTEEIGAAAPSPSSKSKSPPSQANAELLQAVRALSDQVGALQIEQKSLREMVEKKGADPQTRMRAPQHRKIHLQTQVTFSLFNLEYMEILPHFSLGSRLKSLPRPDLEMPSAK